MSQLRPGRGGEGRRSVFYTPSNEDWEMVDHPSKDLQEQMAVHEITKKPHSDTHRSEEPFLLGLDASMRYCVK